MARTRSARPRPKRISFTDFEACHLYEWLTWYWRDEPHNCALCHQLGARLERFIGQPEARRIRRSMKRNLVKKGGPQ
jgi:hypothetical protein